jgi:hypothetical protein
MNDLTDKKQIDYRCIVCGKNMEGKVRVQNDVLKYVKCLTHGLGIERSENQPS